MKWCNEVVYVFMYSYIEAAEAENAARFSICVVNKIARLRNSFTQRHTEHAGFIFN